MTAIERQRIDVIMIEDVSRISRDFVDSAQLFKGLRYERIPLISVADGIDTPSNGASYSVPRQRSSG